MPVSQLQGTLNIANIFLALVAGLIAISLFRASHKHRPLKPWKILIVVLILFVIQEILGSLVAFGIIGATFVTHLIPSFMIFLTIVAVDLQIKEHTVSRKAHAAGQKTRYEQISRRKK